MAWGNEGSRARTSTTEHKNRRQRILTRDQHQCQIRGPRCTHTATDCDHIRNVKAFTNPADAEKDQNCQAVCSNCHAHKTALEGVAARAKRRVKLKLPTQRHPGLR